MPRGVVTMKLLSRPRLKDILDEVALRNIVEGLVELETDITGIEAQWAGLLADPRIDGEAIAVLIDPIADAANRRWEMLTGVQHPEVPASRRRRDVRSQQVRDLLDGIKKMLIACHFDDLANNCGPVYRTHRVWTSDLAHFDMVTQPDVTRAYLGAGFGLAPMRYVPKRGLKVAPDGSLKN